MLSTSSCSKTIIRENLTRYWAVPAMGLLGLLMVGLIPFLISYKSFQFVAGYAISVVSGSSFAINFVITILAVVASSVVFGYLHNPVSSNTMHAIPVRRSGLFASAYVSGWIMTALPIVIFPMFLMIARGAKSNAKLDNETVEALTLLVGEIRGAKDIFTLPHLLGFIITSLVVATFVYSLACLAAVLSGRSVIHVLLALFLMILPNTLVLEADAICGGYLFGFRGLDINLALINALNYASDKEAFAVDIGYLLYYLALSAIFAAASVFIYKKIKLERIGNATTFPVIGDVLAALLTVMCAIGFAHMLAWIGSDNNIVESAKKFAAIAVVSSILFYIIMRMIADSSFSVFNMKNLAKYGICLAVIAVILTFTAFDITGYGKWVPSDSSVASVHVDSSFPNSVIEVEADFKDAKTIEAFAKLQQAAINEKGKERPENYYSDTFNLTWTLKDGSKKTRSFEAVAAKGFDESTAAMKAVYDSEEYRDKMHIDIKAEVEKSKRIRYMSYSANDAMEDYVDIKKEDWEGVLEAVDKDLSSRSFDKVYKIAENAEEEDFSDDIDIEVEYKDVKSFDEVSAKTYSVHKGENNLRNFLKEKGYIK